MDTFELEIATPARLLLRATVVEAQIPALNGYIGVLPGHAPLIGELGTGRLTYRTASGENVDAVVSGGFCEIQPNRTIVLADLAERPEEIDAGRAQTELAEAERLERSSDPKTDYEAAIRAARLAQARLEVARKA